MEKLQGVKMLKIRQFSDQTLLAKRYCTSSMTSEDYILVRTTQFNLALPKVHLQAQTTVYSKNIFLG